MKNTSHGSIQQDWCSVDELHDAAVQFTAWLEKNGYASYDPYDIWGTQYGLWARRLYYAKHPLGLMLTAPLLIMEMVCPQLRALFIEKQRHPAAEAQLVLAFLNMHESMRKSEARESCLMPINFKANPCWLSKAEELAEELLKNSIQNYSGHCWGYPFDWQSVNGLLPKHTPHIIATPYCYEAFIRLFEVTGRVRYLEVARSASSFVFCDLNDTPTSKDAAAASYTPFDSGKVVNANSYRAFVLFDAVHRFKYDHYFETAWKNLNFILESQRSDGSWLYAVDNPSEAFIDHFHTCFVLKNLYKLNRYLKSEAVKQAIKNGYRYYREALFDQNDNPQMFALAPRPEIVRLEMYNFAEAISLGTLLGAQVPEPYSMAHKLACRLLRQYRLQDGHFLTRIYRGGVRHAVPFLRWPQAQLFYAVTNLLASMVRMSEASAVESVLPTT